MTATNPIDWSTIDVLTFDCYGTLIDWEQGILAAIGPILSGLPNPPADNAVLERYAAHEARLEAGEYQSYRDVLTAALRVTCTDFGAEVGSKARAAFGGLVADWPAFPDSANALARLRSRFDLGVITNCDDDLFAFSNERLGKPFRWVITAAQLRSYKPDRRNFELALERIGAPPERVVHVAQSLFHDHVPAKALGLRTVWVNRRSGRKGFGATPPAEATPDLTVPDMATLAALAT
ncbi:MAG: haloacid dehalogenase type II [Chloroflexota bacterium]